MPIETFGNKDRVLIHTIVCLLSLKPPAEFTEVTLTASSVAKSRKSYKETVENSMWKKARQLLVERKSTRRLFVAAYCWLSLCMPRRQRESFILLWAVLAPVHHQPARYHSRLIAVVVVLPKPGLQQVTRGSTCCKPAELSNLNGVEFTRGTECGSVLRCLSQDVC